MSRTLLALAGGESTYYATAFSDLNYFAGANGSGLAQIGTFEIIYKLLALPGAAQRVVACREGGGGGYHVSGSAPGDNVLGLTVIKTGGLGYATIAAVTHVAGDVGKLFVVHFTVTAGAGAEMHAYCQGAENGTGSACEGTPQPAGAGAGFWVGRYQPTVGYSAGSWIGFISATMTATVMTPAQIADRAALVMARTSRLIVPALPGGTERYVNPVHTTWPDRDGGETPLSEVGTVTVTAL